MGVTTKLSCQMLLLMFLLHCQMLSAVVPGLQQALQSENNKFNINSASGNGHSMQQTDHGHILPHADHRMANVATLVSMASSTSGVVEPAASGILRSSLIVIAAFSIGILLGISVIAYVVYKTGFAGMIARATGANALADKLPQAEGSGDAASKAEEGSGYADAANGKGKWRLPFTGKKT